MPTTKQLEAINEIDRNLQIIACAGSGKTDVVSLRIVEILLHKSDEGITPRNIVAFTYNDKSAAELKSRTMRYVKEKLSNTLGIAEMYIGTIHGYCLELLQTYVYKFLKFSVLTEVQARLLVDRYIAQSGLIDLSLKQYQHSRLYLDVLEVMREAEINWSLLENHVILGALAKYNTLLNSLAYLDFAKIQREAVDCLIGDEGLRKKVAERIKYVVVDEYQDVNPLQEKLIRILHELGANICVVGDDDQSIYQWRGTDITNITNFQNRYPDVHIVPLEENFRSSKGVVDCARYVIERNDPNNRLPKSMFSANKQPFERGDVLCLRFNNQQEEAKWIINKIQELIGTPFRDKPDEQERGLALSDCAILLRSVRHDAAPIIDALKASGISYVVKGMNNLFNTPEVQAAEGIFQYLVGRINDSQLRTLWENANLGMSSDSIVAGTNLLDVQKQWENGKPWSAHNLQRTYLDFLSVINLREENIPEERGEVVYYNLGKFSQVISDYEQINYQNDPKNKYEGFANFLHYQAPSYYPEGEEDKAYAQPNTVQVMTVHQAKGQEWPVVFVPALQKNRFPTKKHGGPTKWSVIPKEAVIGAARYDGGEEDERRLFYVALTRSKKYLFCTWAPRIDNKLYKRVSKFWNEATKPDHVLTSEPSRPSMNKIIPKPRTSLMDVVLTFSELKYYFECPYQFKLRFIYGFNPPLDESIGYGKSLHDVLAEVHKRALDKDFLSADNAEELVNKHLHVPFANPILRESLRKAAIISVKRYLQENAQLLDKIEHSEKVVEINIAEGMVVNGRIDLIRRTDTNETIIVDFKSTKRAQDEDVTRQQLHIYAMGYKELTGSLANLIEIHNLDQGGTRREVVDFPLMETTAQTVTAAGNAIRENALHQVPNGSEQCKHCDPSAVCCNCPK